MRLRHVLGQFGLVATAGFILLMVPSEADAQSGQLTVYTSQASGRAVVDLFREKYPEIDVTLLHMVTGPLATRFSNEAESGVNAADVLIIATPSLFEKNPEWFVNLEGEEIQAYDDWPSRYKTDNHVKATFGKATIFYNTNLVSEADVPSTWTDLLDERWRGNIALIDVASSDTYLSWAHNLRAEHGDDFLRKLGENVSIIAKGGLDAAQAVASGAVAISVPPFATHATNLLDQGAPIGIVEAGSPTLGNETSIALVSSAPNPENARLYFEFYLSEAGQGAACAGVSASGIGREVANCLDLPDDFIPPSFDLPDAEVNEINTLLSGN